MLKNPYPKILPIASAGLPYILILGIISAVLALIPNTTSKVIGLIFLILTLFCIFFFRDPERNIPQDPSFILSPADGKILEIVEEVAPQLGEKVKVIKIFLSIFNVHIQRAPFSGKVVKIDYKKGKFLDARHPKASDENENNSITIEGENCKMVVKQIAGMIARRILCWVKVGDRVERGTRLGIIQFGSQVDLFVPNDIEIICHKGEDVVGGQTILALNKKAILKKI